MSITKDPSDEDYDFDKLCEMATIIRNMPENDRKIAKSYVRTVWLNLEKFSSLNKDLKESLYLSKNNNELINDFDIQEQLNKIKEDSLIIYVKQAQLYKVYSPDSLNDYETDEGTLFQKPKYGPVYEVVRDEHAQKLMIVITDEIRDDRLENIKQQILEFIKSTPTFSGATISDLKVYADDKNTEFMVSSIRLQNLAEKEKFTEMFIRFMFEKGEADIASKIQVRPPMQKGEPVGARFYKIPTTKQAIGHNPYVGTVDQMMTTVTKTSVVNISNTYIFGNVNGNVTGAVAGNVSNSITTKIRKKAEKKTLESFYKHIYDDRPEWFKEGKLVDIDVITDAYQTFFNIENAVPAQVSRVLNGKIFSGGTRSNGSTKKKLITFSDLQKLYKK